MYAQFDEVVGGNEGAEMCFAVRRRLRGKSTVAPNETDHYAKSRGAQSWNLLSLFHVSWEKHCGHTAQAKTEYEHTFEHIPHSEEGRVVSCSKKAESIV